MDTITNRLTAELGIREKQAADTIKLLDEGCTVPFIARYRKEATGGLDDQVLREFHKRLTYLRNLDERKEEVIRLIDEQGKLTDELKAKILKADVLQRVEDLYRPYKQKRKTRAVKAREKGLEPLAELIMKQKQHTGSPQGIAAAYINPDLGVNSAEEALQGAMDIIAETVSDNADFRAVIRQRTFKRSHLSSTAADRAKRSVYEMYYDYTEPMTKIANHRVLAINRGEKEELLKVSLISPDEDIMFYLKRSVIKDRRAVTTAYLEQAIQDAYKRLIAPSIQREIRSTLTERAEEDAIKVFARNTRPLLMIPPVKDMRVLAIDPGLRTGSKVAVLDETGKLLEYGTIYPHPPQKKVREAAAYVKKLIEKHGVGIISIGNGTASRETEQFVSGLLKDLDRTVYYTIVNEAGASIYSASELGTEEYPDIDVSIRGAISIGRRLQDPLAELVKIDPKHIGVGQYQHDLNQTKLSEALTGVVEDCVNSVGVDLNTASAPLLKYVSGIAPQVAKNIVSWRDENGVFAVRKQLKKVKRLGPKAFEQCAGFLRISAGKEPLDATAVHPESYKTAYAFISMLGYAKKDIVSGGFKDIDERIVKAAGNNLEMSAGDSKSRQDGAQTACSRTALENIARELDVGLPTLRDIVQELKKPGRDPREDMPKPVFRSDVLSMKDLKPGMVLTGTVRNVVNFGAFVDIGVKQDGLVHISQLANRYVKNPMDIVSVGDNVKVKILTIDQDRGKISLSMKAVKE